MKEDNLRTALADLPLQGLRFFAQTSSTNDAALTWAADGASDLSLVVADEQTSGRGRGSRRWMTPAGVGLAFSLVLRPKPAEMGLFPHFTALGAVAVCEAVGGRGLAPQIKWPNDVLLGQKKFSGILCETSWLGDTAEYVVLGIGVNVAPGSVPPAQELNFPVTCLETESGTPLDRLSLLRDILQALIYWRSLLPSPLFVRMWDQHLAFRGQIVEIRDEHGQVLRGTLEGLESDGSLRLRPAKGNVFTVRFGEVHLHPVV